MTTAVSKSTTNLTVRPLTPDRLFGTNAASITRDFAVAHFARQLGVEHYLATRLQDSGAIDHVWPEEQAGWVLDLAARLGLLPERTAAVGDSHGDYEMLAAVGTVVFVGEERPSLPRNWLHWPAADIEHVARHLIQRWALHPSNATQAR